MQELIRHELVHYQYLREQLAAQFPDADEETLLDTLEGMTDLNEMIGSVVEEGRMPPWNADERYDGVFYGRAQNQSRALNAAYDKVFEEFDLVVMPTTPQTAHKVPPMPEEDRTAHIAEALNMVRNTAAFDLTGHPSITVPCRGGRGLPVGLMLTAAHFDDATALRAGHAYMTAK